MRRINNGDELYRRMNNTYRAVANLKSVKPPELLFEFAQKVDYTIDDEDFEEYGVIYVEGEQDDKYIVIEFFLPESITTPSAIAGIYPVNTSTDDQTVMSGSYDGEVYPSFAGTLDDEGYVEKIWYLVTGNVTVADNFDITVAAKNSKDHNIAVTLKATSTSIKNAEVMQKVVKAIENGQLIINVNGVRYNVNGAIVIPFCCWPGHWPRHSPNGSVSKSS